MKRMRLIFSMMLMGICLFAVTAHAQETKVQLHDTMTLDSFVEAYNGVSEYPIADYSTHSTKGDYEAYIAEIDPTASMVIHVNGEGKISNIVFAHRGDVSEEARKKMMSIFACINIALGYPATENGMDYLAEAFQRLDVSAPEILAARLKRADIQRDYTFVKRVVEEQPMQIILMEAVAE